LGGGGSAHVFCWEKGKAKTVGAGVYRKEGGGKVRFGSLKKNRFPAAWREEQKKKKNPQIVLLGNKKEGRKRPSGLSSKEERKVERAGMGKKKGGGGV